MTSLFGGTQGPQHGSRRNSLRHGPNTLTFRRRPRAALEHTLDIADVQDASRLLECSQIERQLRFQNLVRRYIAQILYGCTSVYCTTPTCLTCNKRLISRPFRPPTQLTARAFAYYLASQDSPYRGLCPHQLKVDPGSLEITGADGLAIQTCRDGTGQICNVYPSANSFALELAHAKRNLHGRIDGRIYGETKEHNNQVDMMDAIAQRHQAKKDAKSLGQNLYDTVTMIISYSKQLPSPLSVFALLRSAPAQERHLARNAIFEEPIVLPNFRHVRESSDVPVTKQANGHIVTSTMNGSHKPVEASSQILHINTEQYAQPNSMSITPAILNNGQHVYKIQHLPKNKNNMHIPDKSLGLSQVDGTLEQLNPETTKVGIKTGTKTWRTGFNTGTDMKARSRDLVQAEKSGDVEVNKLVDRPLLPVTSHLTCEAMDHMKEDVYHHRNEQPSDFNFVVDYDTNRRFRPTKPFVNRSLFFTLSNPETLLRSFRERSTEAYQDSPLSHLDSYRLTNAFRDWNRRNGALVFDSLWIALEALFRPPPELDTQKSPRLKPSRKDALSPSSLEQSSFLDHHQTTPGRYLLDEEAAHIIMICVHALTSLVSNGWSHTWVQLRKFRGWGVIIPGAQPQADHTDGFAHPWLSIVDELEYEPAIRLADKLLRGIGTRMCFEHVLASLRHRDDPRNKADPSLDPGSLTTLLIEHLKVVERVTLARKAKMKVAHNPSDDPGWTVTATFMEWLRTIIIKQWDGQAEVVKWNSVGTAVRLLNNLHASMGALNLRPEMFHIPYFNEHIDVIREPFEFLNWEERPNSFHIFQYPFLFPKNYLIGYFRTVNFTNMLKQFEQSGRTTSLENRLDDLFELYRDEHWSILRTRLKVTLSDYLVLEISRKNSLQETLDRLWGQEKRMLMKPLKVRMGMQEGEVGLDQGGVTYEFFRLVLSEAFKPDTGMFTIDEQTRMIWFQPTSFEPVWKFQMLGVLFSLAVYNGITLPVTFPVALYRHLLGSDHPHSNADAVTVNDIRDGWPTLAKSFDQLLAYDGNVADFMRDYTFSFEAFGHHMDVDMQAFEGQPWPADHDSQDLDTSQKHNWRPDLTNAAWVRPGSSHDGSPLEVHPITNSNRVSFVRDYIQWLTHRSIKPQLEAFAKGFHTCLHPRSLEMFTPTALRELIEGSSEISIPSLKTATRYEEGYSANHPTILDFWSIVEQYSQDKVKRLLEFITASERVPVTGFESMNFSIVRSGSDTQMLPTSSTCFGKLMLPEYESKKKMASKLELAIQNSKGFGVV